MLALASFAQCLFRMKQFLATISTEQLHEVTGGMRLEGMRQSTNVEDRRPEWAKRRDDAWFKAQREPQVQTVPLPPRRPDGI